MVKNINGWWSRCQRHRVDQSLVDLLEHFADRKNSCFSCGNVPHLSGIAKHYAGMSACRNGGKYGFSCLQIAGVYRKVCPVPELMRLIEGHLDRYGVTRAEFARRIGTRPQTIQNWKDKTTILPQAELLRGVANVIDAPYLIVLDAALVDSGYRDTTVDDVRTLEVRIKALADRDPAGLRQLAAYVRLLEREIDAEDESGHASRDLADRIADIIRREFDPNDSGNSSK